MLAILAFSLTIGAFFAYSGKVRLIIRKEYKQRSSTVSKKALTVSKKASPILYYLAQGQHPTPDTLYFG